MNGAIPNWTPSFAFGAVFILFLAAARMRGHGADRSFTTFPRYLIASGLYAVWYLALYAIALCVLWVLHENAPLRLWDFLTQRPEWIALFTVAVLVYLPLLSHLDRLLRRQARKVGGMPDEMIRLRDAIGIAPRSIPREKLRELHFRMLRRGIDLGSHSSVPDQTLHSRFQQASELMCIIECCEQDSRFTAFMGDNAPNLQALTRSFDRVSFRSSRTFEAIGRLHKLANTSTGSSGWETLGTMVETQIYCDSANELDPVTATNKMLIVNRRDELRYFIEDAATFLARLALASRRTYRGRIALMCDIGIQVKAEKQPRLGILVAVFGGLLVSILGVSAYLNPDAPYRDIAFASFMVSTCFVVSLLCAVYPKQYFAFANSDIYGRRPWAFFAVAGLSALLLSFVISFMFRLAKLRGDLALTITESWVKWPYLLLECALAVTVAVLIQDRLTSNGRRREHGRAFDAVVVALALAGATSIAHLVLTGFDWESRITPFAVAFVAAIGAAIGFFVPNRFRTDASDLPHPTIARLRAGQPSADAVHLPNRVPDRMTG